MFKFKAKLFMDKFSSELFAVDSNKLSSGTVLMQVFCTQCDVLEQCESVVH